MEVRIGIIDCPREIAFQSSLSPEAIEKQIVEGLQQGLVSLTFSDDKGKKFVVPVKSLAYAEIAAGDERRVGFIA